MLKTYDFLKQELEDEILYTTDNIKHAIYIIKDIMIDGEFYNGMRTVDHNSLVEDRYNRDEWVHLLKSGIVVVHETKSYISDKPYRKLDELGYKILPLSNNHINGFNNT